MFGDDLWIHSTVPDRRSRIIVRRRAVTGRLDKSGIVLIGHFEPIKEECVEEDQPFGMFVGQAVAAFRGAHAIFPGGDQRHINGRFGSKGGKYRAEDQERLENSSHPQRHYGFLRPQALETASR